MTMYPTRPFWVISLGWVEGREQKRGTQDKQEALKFKNEGYYVTPDPEMR